MQIFHLRRSTGLELITHSEAETEAAGEALASRLSAGSIVALRGGLGSGKTAFTRGFARGLGITARVTSPTFTIVNEYVGTPPLFHFDLYRLHDAFELDAIGFYEYTERGGICVIEWSEILGDELPQSAVIVTLEVTGDEARKITIDGADI